MANDMRFYRIYYPKMAWILLGMSMVILILTSVCILKLVIRQEPDYYASSLNGSLTPLKTIQIAISTQEEILV